MQNEQNEHDDESMDPIPNPDETGCFAAFVVLIAASAASGAALLMTAKWILRVVGR